MQQQQQQLQLQPQPLPRSNSNTNNDEKNDIMDQVIDSRNPYSQHQNCGIPTSEFDDAENQKFSLSNTPNNGSWIITIPNFTHKRDQFYTSIFPLVGANWRLKIYPDGKDSTGKLSIFVSNCDMLDNPFFEKSVSYKIILVNSKKDLDIEKFSAHNFNMKELNHGYVTFVRLFTILNVENGFLVNNRLKIRIDMASTSPLIDNSNKFNIGHTQTYSYRIPNVSKKLDAFTSPIFKCCDKHWSIKVHPCGQPVSNQMSVYLEYKDSGEENVLFSLELVSQTYPDKSIKNWVQYTFNNKNLSFGYPKFIGIFSLFDQEMGFLINDSIIINVTLIQLKPQKRRLFGL